MKCCRNLAILTLAVHLLSACGGGSDKPPYPGVKIGKPYQIYGRWYKPRYEPDYDEIGMASWYGPGFHGGKTANGERYDQADMTAAHRTLPLPSIVRVTNLYSGKSILVKVNDRGPFSRDRILDLSYASASELGVVGPGTAKVRVQFLEKETREYIDDSNNKGIHYAMNKVRGVDPVMASTQQEQHNKPQFYVMKVPDGKSPPPDAVIIADEDASKYPVGDIFAKIDGDPSEKEATAQEPAPREGKYVSYLDTPRGSYSRQGEVVQAAYVAKSDSREGALASLSSLYYVQAGTFGVEDNAANLTERLKGYQTKIITSKAGGKSRYRVLVGPYEKASEAKNILSKLSPLGISSGKIVRE